MTQILEIRTKRGKISHYCAFYGRPGVGTCAYRAPSENIAMTASFFLADNGNFHKLGIGNRAIIESIPKLLPFAARYADVMLPQCPPGVVLSQL